MTNQLMILRHAKSDWNSNAKSDFDRPLNKRGKADAPRLGQYLARHRLVPDLVLTSPAKRAQKTARLVCEQMNVPASHICFNESMYLADLNDLLGVLHTLPESARRVMLVGHNPGIDELLQYLVKERPPRTDKGKIMTTAACAILNMLSGWDQLSPHMAQLEALIRPKEI